MMELQTRLRREAGKSLPVLMVRWPTPLRVVSSAPHGGGLGSRRWVLNAQVPQSYARRDPDHHLQKLSVSLGLKGRGVGMLTACDLRLAQQCTDDGVDLLATIGVGDPILAAAPDDRRRNSLVGTINILAVLPERLCDAALVNAVATVTEAKAQALFEAGLRATGTPTDAVCVACPEDGRPHDFGGPRSLWGARLARSVHRAVLAGLAS